jgi:hypothetical protein
MNKDEIYSGREYTLLDEDDIVGSWYPMFLAPRDGTQIFAKFKMNDQYFYMRVIWVNWGVNCGSILWAQVISDQYVGWVEWAIYPYTHDFFIGWKPI